MKNFMNAKSAKLSHRISVALFGMMLVMASCFNEESEVLKSPEMTITESKIDSEMQSYLDKLDIESDIIGDPVTDPTLLGCRGGLVFRDFANSATTQAVPFYESATLVETTRADGLCNFPVSLNRPCLFVGTVTIKNTAGLSGNYRVIAAWGTVYNYNNVTSSFTFAYGRPQLPTAILCGTIGDFIFQAQDPLTGGWVNVAFLRLTCSNCSLQPTEGEEPAG